MNPQMILTLIVLAGVVAGDMLACRYVSNKIMALYAQGHFAELVDYTSRGLATFMYPAFNRSLMQFNAYVMLEDHASAESVLNALLAEKRLNADQRRDVVQRAFEYYVEKNDARRAQTLLEEMEATSDPGVAVQARQLFEVVMKGSVAYLDSMLKELEGAAGIRRVQLLYLISQQYENAGNAPLAEKYRQQSLELMANAG